MKQALSEKVRDLLSHHLDPFFRDEGFLREETDYRRGRPGCIQHIFFRFDIKDVPEGRCYYFANLEFPEVEKILNLGRRDEEDVNTVGKQMGYLRKPYAFEEWAISKKTAVAELGTRFVQDVRDYGMPFLEKYYRLENVASALERGELFNLDARDAALKLAVMRYLLGEREESLRILEAKVQELEGRPQQLRFVKLRQYLSEARGE